MHTYQQQNGYVSERVFTASPTELIRMLYEGALSSIDFAVEMLHANDIIGRGHAITKAVNIIHELRSSLNNGAQPEIAASLAKIYAHVQSKLFEAHARKSEGLLLEASRLLKGLYHGWLDVMRRAAAESAVQQRSVSESQEMPLAAINPYASAFDGPASGRSWAV